MSALLKTLQLLRQEGLSPDLLYNEPGPYPTFRFHISTLSSHAAVKSFKKIVHTAAETLGNLLNPIIGPHAVKCSGPALVSVLSETDQWASSLPFYDSTFFHTLQSKNISVALYGSLSLPSHLHLPYSHPPLPPFPSPWFPEWGI